MALKREFTEIEKMGLSSQDIEIGEKYLRRNKTAGAIGEIESLKVFELFMIGNSFSELHAQFPQYELGQIIMTSAIRKWGADRERMQSTLRDRVKAKVVKSVIDQVDFLTAMLQVSSTEHMNDMRKYILDPANNPAPSLRIKSIKDYKEIADVLGKIVQGATPTGKDNKVSPMFDALSPQPNRIEKKEIDEDPNMDDLLAGE